MASKFSSCAIARRLKRPARFQLGEALAALGDRVGARAHLDEAVELAHASSLAHHLLFLVHAPPLRLEPDPDAAMALVDGSEILLEDQGRCMFCPVSYALAAASVCVRAGRLERARGREAEAATLLRRAVDGYAALGQHLYERRAAALVRL